MNSQSARLNCNPVGKRTDIYLALTLIIRLQICRPYCEPLPGKEGSNYPRIQVTCGLK